MLAFIDELETNNKDLMKFIDQSNFNMAADYKSKVIAMLGERRPDKGANLRVQNNAADNPAAIERSVGKQASRSCEPTYQRRQNFAQSDYLTSQRNSPLRQKQQSHNLQAVETQVQSQVNS